jgi:threonine/homoserine/homoserine lactone efflux protein
VRGGLFVLVALRRGRGRPRDEEEAPTPRWMGAIDAFTPLRALGAGAVLAGANPKNLLLAVGAAATIAQTGIPGGEQAAAYAIFAVIGTVGVGAPVAIYFAMGDRARPILDRLRTWMGHNNAVIMAVLCLVIGAKLVGDAIAGMS